MDDFGSICGGGGPVRRPPEPWISAEPFPPIQILDISVPRRVDTSMGRYIGISAHLSIGPSMCRHIDDLGPIGGTLGSIWVALGPIFVCQTAEWVAKKAIRKVQGPFGVDFGLKNCSFEGS